MEKKIKQYVVVAVYDLFGTHDTELIGIADYWNRAFGLLEAYDYNHTVKEELTGTWLEASDCKWIDVDDRGRASYHEAHYLTCLSEEADCDIPGMCAVILHIFEN